MKSRIQAHPILADERGMCVNAVYLPVIPQVYSAKMLVYGRSSDLSQFSRGLPSSLLNQWLIAKTLCSTAIATRIANGAGITAAGTVGDSHPIPFSCPFNAFSPEGRATISAAKVALFSRMARILRYFFIFPLSFTIRFCLCVRTQQLIYVIYLAFFRLFLHFLYTPADKRA